MPTGDTKGTFGETMLQFTGNGNPDSATYLMKDGLNFGLLIQYAPFKKSNFKIISGFQYIYMSQNKDYPDSSSSTNVNLNLRMIQLSAGAGYMFSSKRSILNPFIETSISVNFFGGSYTEIPPNRDAVTYTLNPTIRLGILTGAGLNIKVGKRLGVEVGARYHLSNLLGKSISDDSGKKYSLNDKEGTANSKNFKNRNITFLQIYGGISIYLGL